MGRASCALLDAHAEAEERFFYPEVLKIGHGAADSPSASDETKDAIKDHNEIRDAASAVEPANPARANGARPYAKANKANGDHMAEEERQGLAVIPARSEPRFAADAGGAIRRSKRSILKAVKPVDKDPDEYVKEK